MADSGGGAADKEKPRHNGRGSVGCCYAEISPVAFRLPSRNRYHSSMASPPKFSTSSALTALWLRSPASSRPWSSPNV